MSTSFRLLGMYMAHRSVPASVKVVLGEIVYDLTFCADCVSPVELRTCDGKKAIIDEETGTCIHLKNGPIFSYHQERDFLKCPSSIVAVFGCPAVKIMRERVLPHFRAQSGVKHMASLFDPVVAYKHASKCIHGTHPDAIIQGCKGVFKGIFFSRCNGEYANALGEPLIGGPSAVGLTLDQVASWEQLERQYEGKKEEPFLVKGSWWASRCKKEEN